MKVGALIDMWKDRNFLRRKAEILEAKPDRYEKKKMLYSITNIFKDECRKVKIS